MVLIIGLFFIGFLFLSMQIYYSQRKTEDAIKKQEAKFQRELFDIKKIADKKFKFNYTQWRAENLLKSLLST